MKKIVLKTKYQNVTKQIELSRNISQSLFIAENILVEWQKYTKKIKLAEYRKILEKCQRFCLTFGKKCYKLYFASR
ncbi:MAG: hypothetical protein RSB10_04860 [Clostridia bacterium]